MLMLALPAMWSCSDDKDDDKGNGNSEPQESVISKIAGTWYCTSQLWEEDKEFSEYKPSRDYSIVLDDDFTGYMISGSDELFQIYIGGHPVPFGWRIITNDKTNYLYVDIEGGWEYRIIKLTANRLTMAKLDEVYDIVCEFVKQKP